MKLVLMPNIPSVNCIIDARAQVISGSELFDVSDSGVAISIYAESIHDSIWCDVKYKENTYFVRKDRDKRKTIMDGSGNAVNIFGADEMEFVSGSHVQNRFVGVKRLSARKRFVYSYDYSSKELYELEVRALHVSQVDDGIYFRCLTPGVVHKCNIQLEALWIFEHQRFSHNIHANTALQEYKDSIIIYLGTNKDDMNDGEIVAIHKDKGSLKWSRIFPGAIDNCQVIGNKVYIAHAANMIVLDSNTGETLLERDSGLRADKNTTLWTDGEYHYFLSNKDKIIRVYDNELVDLIGEIELPTPYTVHPGNIPFSGEGKVYIPLVTDSMTLKSVVYGLLIIKKSELQLGMPYEVDLERQPEMDTSCVGIEEKSERYEISINHSVLDDILRFCEIEIRRIAAVHGNQMYSSNEINPKFNGSILLRVAKYDFADDAKKKLDFMVNRVSEWVDIMGITAGMEKKEVKASWKFES